MLIPLAILLAGAVDNTPPPIRREFRGAWVASVDNIDWPSSRTLTPAQQRDEMIRLLDKAVEMHLNAIILQVRPSADALYPSKIEPWSEYLTGRQGVPPEPRYDPLAFAVREAHARGLELHCWINPYRAKSPAQKGPCSSTHISERHPEVVRKYGSFLWMDPGSPLVQKQTLDVVKDLVRRYDIDGIHIDDYFYPYPENGEKFPDDPTYGAYMKHGGSLARADWRRQNVDTLVHAMYREIKRAKPWVQFGISPFGIYRPGMPQGIVTRLDQFAELYADARKWLNNGWCDYFAPQLYWQVHSKGQSYGALLRWWAGENKLNRNLWPGNYTSSTDPKEGHWNAQEIVSQVDLTRSTNGATGNIHFSMKALEDNYGGVADALRGSVYSDVALPPPAPWLDKGSPATPKIRDRGEHTFTWTCPKRSSVMWFALWARYGKLWRQFILPGPTSRIDLEPTLPAGPLSYVAVAAVDRVGVMGAVSGTSVSRPDSRSEESR